MTTTKHHIEIEPDGTENHYYNEKIIKIKKPNGTITLWGKPPGDGYCFLITSEVEEKWHYKDDGWYPKVTGADRVN